MILPVAQSFGSAELGKQLDGWMGAMTLPLDMLLRPKFGSQYYSWTQATTSLAFYKTALVMSGAGTAAANYLYFHTSHKWPIYATLLCMVVLWSILACHVFRIYKLVIDPVKEHDSMTDGPPLPIFKLLPHGDNWAWVRMVWEPLAVCATATLMGLLGLVPYLFVPFLWACAFALFMRAAYTYWEGWRYCRELLDQINHAPIIQAIADGAQPPEKLGRTLFSSIPASTPPNQKKAIAMKMVGLTPEMEALMERR